MSLIENALLSFAKSLEEKAKVTTQKPSEWIEEHFYVHDPRDPITGEQYPPGPIRLADHQRRIINAALEKDEKGRFLYSTIIYSAPKKSGKSAISSAVILYIAYHQPHSFAACLANDGTQSKDRLYGPIYTNFLLHKQLGGIFSSISPNLEEVTLPNMTKIRAVPCDAAGEAGSQPVISAFCFDDETEILTKEGWKKYNEYSMDSEFLTLSKSGKLEYQYPTAINIQQYVGDMYLLNTRRVSLCVTPNHKLYGKLAHTALDKHEFKKFSVEDVFKKTVYGVRVESLGIKNNTVVPECVVIPSTKRKSELRIPVKLYLRFLGWYLSEGCTHKKEAIMLAQKDTSPYFDEILDLVRNLGYVPHVWHGTDAIVFYDTRLVAHVKQFGLAHEKFIPNWIKHLPKEYYDIFYDAYWKGDGNKTGEATEKYDSRITSTNSPQLRDDLMEVAALRGEYVTYTEYQDKRWGRPIYQVNIKKFKSGNRVVGSNKKEWKKIDYLGVIHCPTVPNGIVCIRRNGKVHWQGQSEIWGYTSEKKKRLWVEMTVPPTLYGKAIRWVETYAGYSGESELLEQLYETGFINGQPHPDFNDLQGDDGPSVRINKPARMFTYWDSGPNAHRMLWQQGEEGEAYYQSEVANQPPIEMQRVHYNRWVSSITSFVQDTWWDACIEERLPPLIDKHTPVVVGIDMAVSRDCAALVAVTRNPFDPDYGVAVRGVRVFSPKAIGGIIDQETLVRPVIEDWAKRWNVVCWVYDPHEMAKLAQDLVRSGVGWFKPFGQVQPRAVSDKQLHDMILHKQVVWSPNTTEGDVGYKGTTQETLYKHIIRAGATTKSDSYRIEKLSTQTHIDAAVALSQAAFTCMRLNLSSREMNQNALLEKLRTHQITMEEFLNAQRQRT